MKFRICSRGYCDYTENSITLLEPLGFTFRQSSPMRNGKSFYYTKIFEPSELLEINSLEELIEFTNKYGDCIISDGIIVIDDPDRT